jgi:hypothetical protein
MENIFYKIIIPSDYFYFYITTDLSNFIYDLRWDLEDALTTNANGKYIY